MGLLLYILKLIESLALIVVSNDFLIIIFVILLLQQVLKTILHFTGFFGKDRNIPVHDRVILDRLYKAFENIGISPAQQKRRNVTFHSWRYLYNSLMRGKIHDSKLRRLTGHKTLEMTEHYTTFNLEDYQDVLRIQEQYFT